MQSELSNTQYTQSVLIQILALLVNLMKDYKTNSQKVSFK